MSAARSALAVLVALAATGCATKPQPQWSKAGGDQREVYACKMEAEKAAVSSDPNPFGAAWEKAEKRDRVMDLCMRSKGWTR